MNSLLHRRTQTVYAPGGGGGLPGSQSVDGGIVTIANGASSKAVTFNLAFTSAPAVQGTIIMANNAAFNIGVNPDYSTLTTSGVTFLFGAPVPDGTYRLSWSAIGS
jgi:hypothetical protein